MKAAALLLVGLAGLAAAVNHHPLSDEAINHINSLKPRWTVSH